MKKKREYSRLVAAVVAVTILVSACASPAMPPLEPEATKAEVELTAQPQTETVVETVVEIQTELDPTPRIAVISAFGAELLAFLDQAEIESQYVIGGTTYYVGRLAGNDVVIFLSGVSMVNAAMKTQAAIDHFSISNIVFSGIAGGVSPDLNIGDVVVPARWGQYLESYYAREIDGVFTPPSWWTPEFPNYGMMFTSSVSVVSGEPDAYQDEFWFPADPAMLAVAEAVAESVRLEKCAPEGACLDQEPKVKVRGNGVSGQTFMDNADFRDFVWETFRADALDMETAAVAQVARTNGIPYLAFRSLSDLAGGGPGENQIGTFFELASINSAKLMLAFLEAWSEAESILACFMYVGPIGDHGWSYAHDEGRKFLEENLENVQTLYLESVSDVDAEARLRDLVEVEGCDIIFTTSFSFRDATAVVAADYPDVIFENCSGFLTSDNMGSYFGRMYQAKYLAGVVAGLTTESNKIGYVAPIQIPEIIRLINAATEGARSVNPDVEMYVVWIGNWFDPPAETAAVESMVDAGVDVIFTGTDTTIPVVTADQEGVWSVGYDSCESCQAAPAMCLTTPCWNWGPTYAALVEAVRNGTWKPEAAYAAMADDIVILTSLGPAVGEGAQAAVDSAKTAIETQQDVFCGPLTDNHGELVVAEGECMSDMDLICFDWYVEGVASEVPEGVGCQ